MESKVFSTDDSIMDYMEERDQVRPVNPQWLLLNSIVTSNNYYRVQCIEVVACIYYHGVVVNLDLSE